MYLCVSFPTILFHMVVEDFIEENFVKGTGYSQHDFVCMNRTIIIACQGNICKLQTSSSSSK